MSPTAEGSNTVLPSSAKPGATLVRRLRRSITVYERPYEMSSEDMLAAVRGGPFRETAEVSHWMQAHAVLAKLGRIHTDGTRSKISRSPGEQTLRGREEFGEFRRNSASADRRLASSLCP